MHSQYDESRRLAWANWLKTNRIANYTAARYPANADEEFSSPPQQTFPFNSLASLKKLFFSSNRTHPSIVQHQNHSANYTTTKKHIFGEAQQLIPARSFILMSCSFKWDGIFFCFKSFCQLQNCPLFRADTLLLVDDSRHKPALISNTQRLRRSVAIDSSQAAACRWSFGVMRGDTGGPRTAPAFISQLSRGNWQARVYWNLINMWHWLMGRTTGQFVLAAAVSSWAGGRSLRDSEFTPQADLIKKVCVSRTKMLGQKIDENTIMSLL